MSVVPVTGKRPRGRLSNLYRGAKSRGSFEELSDSSAGLHEPSLARRSLPVLKRYRSSWAHSAVKHGSSRIDFVQRDPRNDLV